MRRGYVHVYTGDGKGKTTAALGLALRAAGYGMKTYMGQFMKGQHYGEHAAVASSPLIIIEQYGDWRCVHRDQVADEHVAAARDGLARAERALVSGQYDVVVLDEINVAVEFGLLSFDDIVKLLERRPPGVEVVLTGRGAPADLITYADLVTDMREVKHYYTRGIEARDGIER
jgi:cob(I)alamin adenosyltransferase